jgi:hypothetical protein
MVSVVHEDDNVFLQVSNPRFSAYCATNKNVRYTLDNVLELCRNYVAYSIFHSTFIPTMKQLVEVASVFE